MEPAALPPLPSHIIADLHLRQAADAHRADIEWHKAFGLTHRHRTTDHRSAETLSKARAAEAFATIKHLLQPEQEARVRVILGRSPRAQKDPQEAVIMARLLSSLAPEHRYIGVGSIFFRALLAKIARQHPGLTRLFAIWLDATDRKIHAAILAYVAEKGEADLQRTFDDHAQEAGIPPEEWWSYPVRTARETRLRQTS